MELKKLWEIILRRKWIIIQAFILIFAVILIGTLLKTPTYRAECYIVIEQQGTQEALLRSIGLEQVSEILFTMNLGQKSSLVTIEMMKIVTKPILDEVVREMDLKNDRGEYVAGPNLVVSNPTFFWYSLWGIMVKPHKQSNVMVILGFSPEPQQAIDFCNTLTRVYIQADIELKHKETTEAARFAEEQSIKAKADWNEAKRTFKEFQETEGLVDFGIESQILINRIAELRAEQNLTELSVKEAEKFGGVVSDPYQIGGQVLSNAGQISQLKATLSQLESQLNSQLTQYTDNHPTIIALRQQIADLEDKLITEKQIVEESGTARYEAIEGQINDYKRRLNEFPEKLYTLAQLSLQADTYQALFEMLLDMKYRLNITKAMQISNLSVLEPAWKAKVFSPNIEFNLIMALVLGLVVGFGLAFLVEYLDDTIKDGESVQTQLEIPLIGTIPLVTKKENQFLDISDTSGSHRELHFLNEAYNIMSYNIKLGSIDNPIKHIMVTSAAPGEGKTSISSNLGIVMARKGKRVVVIDSDFLRPNIYKIFGVSNDKGLTNVLLGEDTIDDVIQASSTEGLYVITTGPKPPSSALLFESQQMKNFIKELELKFDFIIFDTPPILTINDPVILSSYVDKTILVIAANEVSRQVIKQGIATLNKSNDNLLGAVINKFHTEGSHYYYYYYYYHSPDDSGNGFKKFLYNSLALVGIRKKRKRRRRTHRKVSMKT